MKTLNEIKGRLSSEALEVAEATKQEVVLGNALKHFRKDVAMLTQREVAASLNVSQAEVSKLEKRRDMLISTLADYCRVVRADVHISAHSGEVTIQLLTPENVSNFIEEDAHVEVVAG